MRYVSEQLLANVFQHVQRIRQPLVQQHVVVANGVAEKRQRRNFRHEIVRIERSATAIANLPIDCIMDKGFDRRIVER
jgi:hypothetical protein